MQSLIPWVLLMCPIQMLSCIMIHIGKYIERASQSLIAYMGVIHNIKFLLSPNKNIKFNLFSLLNILLQFMSVLNSNLMLHDADKNQPLISLIVKPDFIICSMCAGWVWSASARSRCWRILISCHRLTFSASLCKNINKTGNACTMQHQVVFM